MRSSHATCCDGWLKALYLTIVMFMGLPYVAAQSTDDLNHLAIQVPPGFPQGGLVVQVGSDNSGQIERMARTGRYLIHVLEPTVDEVQLTRKMLEAQNLYGLISVDLLPASGNLPYAENLVNVLYLTEELQRQVSLAEAKRVVCPNGCLVASHGSFTDEALTAAGFSEPVPLGKKQKWMVATKDWPKEMDQWTHPRHAASGNAVSNDLTVGPPRRVRWVVGANSEVTGLVTANGRNFYAGILARDSFNGLRLWNFDITAPNKSDQFVMKTIPRDLPAPVSDGDHVFAIVDRQLVAIEAATGKVESQLGAGEKTHTVLHDDGIVISADDQSVQGIDVASGKVLWNYDSSTPRGIVAGDDTVALIQGNARRGETCEAVALDKKTGTIKWIRSDYPWLNEVDRSVYHDGVVAYEVSTFNDDGPDNAIHVLSAENGDLKLDRDFLPGMNHRRQARAMFIGEQLWVLHGGKDKDKNRLPTEVSAIDFKSGNLLMTHNAGLAHCFPPVATPRYIFSGELDLTDLITGQVDANRITKANCNADFGWLPANGLIYVTPKHCVCWPMLRGYAALAPDRTGGNPALDEVTTLNFPFETGVAPPEASNSTEATDWPVYRRDGWRSSSQVSAGPAKLNELWSIQLHDSDTPTGIITKDWSENPFVKGPISPPVIAGGKVFVARPDAHEVVAIDESNGKVAWRFTANGRVDTPPTIHRGLCLFGSKNGTVYCLRAADGELVWRRQVAPLDERIVAYGQLESPWPVPGSLLVVDDVAYFAAGRQSLADGGILVFAVDPPSGDIHWVRRLDTIPQTGFYNSSGLEFDNFDLLHREGDSVAMSRWLFKREDGEMSVDLWKAFAPLNTGNGVAMVPQGCWSYAPRHQTRTKTHEAKRPLVTFRDNMLVGCSQEKKQLYRRDFDLDGGEVFDSKWITGWTAGRESRDGGVAWRSQRLAEKANWVVELCDPEDEDQEIVGLVLAGNQLFVASSDGQLRIVSAENGATIDSHLGEPVMWDGLAIADGRVFASTPQGKLICLGESER